MPKSSLKSWASSNSSPCVKAKISFEQFKPLASEIEALMPLFVEKIDCPNANLFKYNKRECPNDSY
jgi:hypothetical protein